MIMFWGANWPGGKEMLVRRPATLNNGGFVESLQKFARNSYLPDITFQNNNIPIHRNIEVSI